MDHCWYHLGLLMSWERESSGVLSDDVKILFSISVLLSFILPLVLV